MSPWGIFKIKTIAHAKIYLSLQVEVKFLILAYTSPNAMNNALHMTFEHSGKQRDAEIESSACLGVQFQFYHMLTN